MRGQSSLIPLTKAPLECPHYYMLGLNSSSCGKLKNSQQLESWQLRVVRNTARRRISYFVDRLHGRHGTVVRNQSLVVHIICTYDHFYFHLTTAFAFVSSIIMTHYMSKSVIETWNYLCKFFHSRGILILGFWWFYDNQIKSLDWYEIFINKLATKQFVS